MSSESSAFSSGSPRVEQPAVDNGQQTPTFLIGNTDPCGNSHCGVNSLQSYAAENSADVQTPRGQQETGDQMLNAPETPHGGAADKDSSEESATSGHKFSAPKDPLEGQAGPSTANEKGLTVEDVFSRIISNDAPGQFSRASPLRESEEVAAGLDKASLEFEFSRSLNKGIDDLVNGTIKAVRKAYEGRIKADVKAEWGLIIRKWLDQQHDEQKRKLAAEFDENYRQQWLRENAPVMQKALEDRAEAAYHKLREVREMEAEKRWAEKDHGEFLNQKRTEIHGKVEAELRRKLEEGVVAALRAEHMDRLREEARQQVTNEMLESLQEQARQEIIDDQARYERNMHFAKGVFSKLPADAAPGIIGNGLFGIYRPDPDTHSETGNLPQPTRMPGRVVVHSSRGESSRMAGDASQSSGHPSTRVPSLLPALEFHQPPNTHASAPGDMPPPPRPGGIGGIVPPRRSRLTKINPGVGQAGNESAQKGSPGQQNPLKTPMARLRAADQAFHKQLKDRMPGTRTPSPKSYDDLSFLDAATPKRRAEASSAGPEPQPDSIGEGDSQAQRQAQSEQEQQVTPAPQTRTVPSQKAGKKRARDVEDEAGDEASGEDKENQGAGAKKPVTKRPRVEPSNPHHGMSTRNRAAVRRAAAARATARTRANSSSTTARAPAPLPAVATTEQSTQQSPQPSASVSRKPATRANRLKRGRVVEEVEAKEEDDEASPPPAKRTRLATAKRSAANTTTATSSGIAAAPATAAVNVKQEKRKPGRPPKAKGKAPGTAAKKTRSKLATPPPLRGEKTPEALGSPYADQAARAYGDGSSTSDDDDDDGESVPKDKDKGKEVRRSPSPLATPRQESPVREDTAENRMRDAAIVQARVSGNFFPPTRSSNVNDPFASSMRGQGDSSLAAADAEQSAGEEKDEGKGKAEVVIIDLENEEDEEDEL
ncbi:MAG: hypothetical protein Q9225_003050 [Loekoesia sp. 1 TL-2023]